MRQGCRISYTKALRKQKWLGDVQIWKIRALFGLEEFTCSQTCMRALKAIPKWKKRQWEWCESFQSQEQIHERTWHIITDWLGLETMVWILGNIYWSLSRQVTGRKPMGTKTCSPTSQRPIIASKFYQKATAANLLVQPNIDPRSKIGFWKKRHAAAASCQPHIGLISSNGNVCSNHLHWCLAATFALQAPAYFKNPPLLMPQRNRTRKLCEVKATNWSWTTLSPACSPHARNDYRET